MTAPYPLRPSDIAFLSSHPFECHWSTGTPRFVSRLNSERELYDAPTASPDSYPGFSLTVVAIQNGESGQQLTSTLRSIALQTFPGVRCAVWSAGAAASPGFVPDLAGDYGGSPQIVPTLDPAPSDGGSTLCFVRAGDILHPSLAHALALRWHDRPFDVAVWNDIEVPAAPRPRSFIYTRRPALERHTLRHLDYIGKSFAVRGEALEKYMPDWRTCADSGRFWPALVALAEQADLSWTSLPEFLAVRYPADLLNGADDRLALHARHWTGFDLHETPEAAFPYFLRPRRPPASVAVVIPFRDKPELTARSVQSVFAQHRPFPVQVVLVNNQSEPGSVAQVTAQLATSCPDLPFEVVDYDAAFNHSAQCNLAARRTDAEVLVFLNNDARFTHPETLEDMCRWALEPDIATVGVRVESETGRLLSAGLRLRLAWTIHESPLEEDRSRVFAHCVRETAGNTFACAAIGREKGEAVGWLDSLRFPNGFNDVEFCLRAREAGYTHLCLGHRSVVHEVHASRQRTDETAQKLLLRQLYPCATGWAMQQLSVEYRREQLSRSQLPRAFVGRLLDKAGLRSSRARR